MKISGFTFIRNGLILDYPFIESIRSLLPMVDEFVVNAVDSDDGTLEALRSIKSKKVKIIQSKWKEELRGGGKLFKYYTDTAKQAAGGDWLFYLQGDEVVHERYLNYIKCALAEYLNAGDVDGFALKFKHFYGSYDLYHEGEGWVRNEVRIIRNSKEIESYNDASGFRYVNGKKLSVVMLDAYVFHYGWARKKSVMKQKVLEQTKWHHKNADSMSGIQKLSLDEIFRQKNSLHMFADTHPAVMQNRLKEREDYLTPNPKYLEIKSIYKIRNFIADAGEFIFNRRIGEYENFRRSGYYKKFKDFTSCALE